MPETIESLWPPNIKSTVLTPLAILRTQANVLQALTKGLLEARVSSVREGDSVVHQLDIVAPALNYEHRVLSVKHHTQLVYPAQISGIGGGAGAATNDEDFKAWLRKALATPDVASVIASLIARSNEQAQSSSDQGAARE